MKTVHIPVLLDEVLESLDLKSDDKVFDGTLGGGGYAEGVCQKIPKGVFIGTDLNVEAIKIVKSKLNEFLLKKFFFNRNYSEARNIFKELKLLKINKAVLDLGLSSDQLENGKKGLSFQNLDDDLDMNLSVARGVGGITASEILNNWSESNLADIFFYYGGEKASRKIAKAIVDYRKDNKIEKVIHLVKIIEKEIGIFYKNKKINPSTKIFQALRITVNDEIRNLEKALEEIIHSLEKEGRLAVGTFNSMEDGLVKRIFREWEMGGIGVRLNKKVIKPTVEEVQKNRRSRSAKLRVFKKI